MPATLSTAFWLLLAAALLSGCAAPDQPLTAAPPPAPTADTEVLLSPEELPALSAGFGSGQAAAVQCVQEFLVLPFGTPVPADTSRAVVEFEVRSWGATAEVRVVRGVSPAVDSAVLAAVYQLPFEGGKPMSVDSFPRCYTLTVPAPGVASPAQRREANTRWRRTAVRRPGESDTAFVRRVLPLSYRPLDGNDLQALAWRPGAYGRQLVFTAGSLEPCCDSNNSRNWQATDVFVLDPFRPRTYAVQRFHIGNIGDLSGQTVAPFLADVNADGHPDLVTLITYSQSVPGPGHMNYYRVQVWRTAGLDAAGRPRYREDETPYPYLEYRQDETPGPYPQQEFTPATVRRLLARHLRRATRPRPPVASPALPDSAKKTGAASLSEGDPGP